jgi:phenylalanyl-tRNA synthetase alpha subunit
MFGVEMAKSFMKKAKKAVKSAKKEAKKEVKKVSSSARDHIESLAKQRRDAAVMWGMIKDGNHSTDEIKQICKEKGFDALLGEL